MRRQALQESPTHTERAHPETVRRRPHRWHQLGLVALLAASCVKNPVTGARELSLLSPEQEKRIGQEAAAEVENFVGLTDDPALRSYIRQVGVSLVQHSPRQGVDYRFDVIDMAVPNAFALPDGHLYVSRGMLALTNAEAELAAILAHEIGHVAARHAAQRYSRAAPVGILAGLTSAVVGVVSARAANAVTDFGGGLNSVMLAPYGREQEREADKVGQDIAFASGRDPGALSSALRNVGRFEEHVLGAGGQTSWLDSHPRTSQRVADTDRYARSLALARSPTVERNQVEHVRRLDGLLLGKNARHGVFRGQRFVHPELGITVRFPPGWRTESTKPMAGALAPQDDAFFMMGVLGKGEDPLHAAGDFARDAELTYSQRPVARSIGALPGAQARVVVENLDITLAFVALGDRILQLLAVTRPERLRAYAPVIENWFGSLDHASDHLLAGIREERLSVIAVEQDVPLVQLLARQASSAPPLLVAILNGMDSPTARPPLPVIKLPILTAYRSRDRARRTN